MSQDANSEQPTRTYGPDDVEPTKRIGNFRLLEKIGEGAMGVVWRAEQTEPVYRRVAIKITKTQVSGKDLVARFEQERQALAMMNHANIAKIFDAGTTDSGNHYFAMELVEGAPISTYCDEHRLPLEQRLRLVADVCLAVQHAHQKGIMHRDLKPSNILVAEEEGKPIPKVIDFGLAKAIESNMRLTDKTVHTQHGMPIGTFHYMSPEQANPGAIDVDTRTDIYSLGIVLYELITGTTPLKQSSTRDMPLVELVQKICHSDPPKPTTYLSSSQATATDISKRFNSEPRRLRKRIRGDLDWIVMAAIDRDRNRRYATAAEFADDINRFLNNEPIRVRPPSLAYRGKKFVQKHRALVSAVSFAMSLLLVALLMVSTLWANAKRANVKIQASENRAVANEQIANDRAQELETSLAVQDQLIQRGSATAVARGRDAWKQNAPDRAIAHFSNALALQPNNQVAQSWLYHSLMNHRTQGWNPPDFVIGGDPDTATALLSQDGRFALTQHTDGQVFVWSIDQWRILFDSNSIAALTIEDLHVDANQFLVLCYDQKNRTASVWDLNPINTREVCQVDGESHYGELQFSNTAKYLVSSRHSTRIIGVKDGLPIDLNMYDGALLNADDSLLVVSTKQGIKLVDVNSLHESLSLEEWIDDSTTEADSIQSEAEKAPSGDSSSTRMALGIPGMPLGYPGPEKLTEDAEERTSDPVDAKEPNSSDENAHQISEKVDRVPSVGIFPGESSRLTIRNGKPNQTWPGYLVTVSDVEEQADLPNLGMYDLAKHQPTYYKLENTKHFFCAPTGSWVNLYESGGCGTATISNPWTLDYFWESERKIMRYTVSLDFVPFRVTFGEDDRVFAVMSRPLPQLQIKIFDLRERLPRVQTLNLPHVELPPNQVVAQLRSNDEFFVSTIAKNAIGFWDLRSLATASNIKTFDKGQGLVQTPLIELTATYFATYLETHEGYVHPDYLTYVQPVSVRETRTYLPLAPFIYSDLRGANGGELLYSMVQAAEEITTELEPGDLVTNQVTTTKAVLLAPTRPEPCRTLNLGTILKPNSVRLSIDRKHRFVIISGDGTPVQNGSKSNSDSESDAKPSPTPALLPITSLMGVLDYSTGEWLLEPEPGKFLGFDPRSESVICVGPDQQSIQRFNPIDQQFEETDIVIDSAIIHATIDHRGEKIAIIDEAGTLTLLKMTGETLFKVPDFGVPTDKLANSLVFDTTDTILAAAIDAAGAYYENAADCKGCSLAVQDGSPERLFLRTRVLDIESRSSYWIEQAGLASGEFVQSRRGVSLSLKQLRSKKDIFGPVEFDWGGVFLSSDNSLICNITTHDVGIDLGGYTRIEAWSTQTDSPASAPIFLNPGAKVIYCGFDESNLRVLFHDDQEVVQLATTPLLTDEFTSFERAEKPLRDFVETLSGWRIDEQGRMAQIDFSHRQVSRETPEFSSEIWNRALQQFLPTRSPQSERGITISPTSSTQSKALSNQLIPDNLIQRKGDLISGFQNQEGFFWQHEGSESQWTRTNRETEASFDLIEISRDDEHVVLQDAKREIDYKFSLDAKDSYTRPSSQPEAEWEKWHLTTPIRVLQ